MIHGACGCSICDVINSFVPGKFQQNHRKIIFKLILVTDRCDISSEIALRWTTRDLSDAKSTLVQVMAWCRQVTSHYLNQCWPRSAIWRDHATMCYYIEAGWRMQNHMRLGTILGYDNGFVPVQRQAIIWTSIDLLSIRPWGTNFNEISIKFKSFHSRKLIWRHHMETFSALLPVCARKPPVTGGFPSQRPVTRSFDVFFDLRLNKRLNNLDAGDLSRHRAHYDVTVTCRLHF